MTTPESLLNSSPSPKAAAAKSTPTSSSPRPPEVIDLIGDDGKNRTSTSFDEKGAGRTTNKAKGTESSVHKSKGPKSKKKVDDEDPSDPKPKRPLSAYNIFFQHERDRVLRSIRSPSGGYSHDSVHCTLYRDPNAKVDRSKKARPPPHGKIGFAQLAKIVGARWKALDATARAHYDELAEGEKLRYRAAIADWHQRNNGKNINANKNQSVSAITAGDNKRKNPFPSEHALSKTVIMELHNIPPKQHQQQHHPFQPPKSLSPSSSGMPCPKNIPTAEEMIGNALRSVSSAAPSHTDTAAWSRTDAAAFEFASKMGAAMEFPRQQPRPLPSSFADAAAACAAPGARVTVMMGGRGLVPDGGTRRLVEAFVAAHPPYHHGGRAPETTSPLQQQQEQHRQPPSFSAGLGSAQPQTTVASFLRPLRVPRMTPGSNPPRSHPPPHHHHCRHQRVPAGVSCATNYQGAAATTTQRNDLETQDRRSDSSSEERNPIMPYPDPTASLSSGKIGLPALLDGNGATASTATAGEEDGGRDERRAQGRKGAPILRDLDSIFERGARLVADDDKKKAAGDEEEEDGRAGNGDGDGGFEGSKEVRVHASRNNNGSNNSTNNNYCVDTELLDFLTKAISD